MSPDGPAPQRLHGPCLAAALAIMLAVTAYPPLLAHAGRADHGLALLLAWAMSAGFVRGVGFVPRHAAWRRLFSGRAMLLALGLAAVAALARAS